MDQNSFVKKTVMISGASGAVGESVVRLLAQDGIKMVLIDLPENIGKLKSISKQALNSGAKVFSYGVDIRKKESIDSLINELTAHKLEIDILINLVGINYTISARILTEQIWDNVVDTNLKANFFLIQAIANYSLLKRKGSIVNMSSQHAIVGNENRVHYCSSKAGMVGMTKALACEWAKYKVRVNCVSPTFILTEKNAEYLNAPYRKNRNCNKILLGEYALPDDAANGAIFLASQKARMITGHNLVIDGGYTIA